VTNRAFLTGLMASVAFIMPAAAQTTDIGEINVQGTPETAAGAGYIIPEDSPKARSTVTKAAIAQQPSSANVYQLLSRLPGVNSYSSDATGSFGGSLSIRGFNSDEIGFTVAGVPVNDSGSYTIFPNEYADSENLLEVDLNQGGADIDQPQGGAVGGAVSMIVEEPKDLFRIKVVQSLGELNFFKSFLRVDTGKIGDSGFKAFMSYSKTETDKFKGPGGSNVDHIDAGAVLETEQGSKYSFNALFNSQLNNNYRNYTLALYRQYGRTLDYEPNLPASFPAPGPGKQDWSVAPAGFPSAYPGQTYNPANYYKYNVNPFNNLETSFTADIKILDNLHMTIQPYYWNGYGTGGGQFHTLAETQAATSVPGGLDLNGDGDKADTIGFYESSVTSTQRPGVNSKITYQPIDWDTIRIGVNFDHSRHHQTGPYERLELDGTFASAFVDENLTTRPNGTLIQFRETTTFNDTTIYYFENTLTAFNDALKIVTGIKRQEVSRVGSNNLPNIVATGNQFAIHPFGDYVNYLPQLSVSYRITPEHLVYANLQKNARAPSNFTLYETVLNTINSQASETNWNLDVGYRYQGETLTGSLSLFATNFQNRQLKFNLPSDPTIQTDLNAGTVHNRGFDFEVGTTKPIQDFNVYGSVSYDKSITQSNLRTGNSFIPTAGKTFPNAPKWVISGVVEYVPSFLPGAFFSLSPKYTSARQSTLVNDEKIKGFTDVDLAAGYLFPDGMFGPLHNTSIQFNVVNLLDRSYLFIANGNGSSAGINAKTIVSNGVTFNGAPPSYGIGAPRFFSVKLSSEFGPVAEAPVQTAAYTPPPIVAPAAMPKSYLVFFDFNKSDLTPQAVSIVDQAAHNAGPAKVTKIDVTGHTDTVGSDAYNLRLSRRRAESVAAQLEKDGIPSSEIAIFAKGKHDLLVPTADGVKEPQNRRVQIVYSDGAAS
jgi:iron complex outermembrane receptor protein